MHVFGLMLLHFFLINLLNGFDKGVELRKFQIIRFSFSQAIEHETQFILFGIDAKISKEMFEIIETDEPLSSSVKDSERVIDIEVFSLRQFNLDLFDFGLILDQSSQKLIKQLELICLSIE